MAPQIIYPQARMFIYSIRIHCPYCHAESLNREGAKHNECVADKAGKIKKCKECGKKFEIPKLLLGKEIKTVFTKVNVPRREYVIK